MTSIKNSDPDRNNRKISNRILRRPSFTLLLIVLVFTMSSSSTFVQIVKPAMATGSLTNAVIIPASNLGNTRTTYDISFKTGTTGTIKTIQMTFPSSFDVSAANKLIERSGIGSGSLSAPSSSILIYTVNNAVTIPAGTTISLEIGRIVNSNVGGIFHISITTENTNLSVIDGPTKSFSFPIKRISGNDVSTQFMIRKTLYDDEAGHAHGWDPNGSTKSFAIFDSEITGASDSEFINVMLRYANLAYCTASPGDTGLFVVHCNSAPVDSTVLDYIITRLPAHVEESTSSSLSTSTSPTSSPSTSTSPTSSPSTSTSPTSSPSISLSPFASLQTIH